MEELNNFLKLESAKQRTEYLHQIFKPENIDRRLRLIKSIQDMVTNQLRQTTFGEIDKRIKEGSAAEPQELRKLFETISLKHNLDLMMRNPESGLSIEQIVVSHLAIKNGQNTIPISSSFKESLKRYEPEQINDCLAQLQKMAGEIGALEQNMKSVAAQTSGLILQLQQEQAKILSSQSILHIEPVVDKNAPTDIETPEDKSANEFFSLKSIPLIGGILNGITSYFVPEIDTKSRPLLRQIDRDSKKPQENTLENTPENTDTDEEIEDLPEGHEKAVEEESRRFVDIITKSRAAPQTQSRQG